MRLYEFEGKRLFEKYGIQVPKSALLASPRLVRLWRKKSGKVSGIKLPAVLKAQVLSGERKSAGGILFSKNRAELSRGLKKLFAARIYGEPVRKILVEECIRASREYYLSLSYDTDTRGPVLAFSSRGGSRMATALKANVAPLDILLGAKPLLIREALAKGKVPSEDINGLTKIIMNLWRMFVSEYALVAEINPLFRTLGGEFIAGDAKVILDDEKVNPGERRFIKLGGDIAILASGGGASLLNIDALLQYKGKPANYTEYSGNPPADVVKALTQRVLGRPGLKGAWVIGGTANFTDIYETLKGFIEGLRDVKPKPAYPIVIRRDGPNQEKAFAMLREVGKKEGYDFHLFNSKTSMAESAKVMVELAYRKR